MTAKIKQAFAEATPIQGVGYAQLIGLVARRLLGEPNGPSSKTELRYGNLVIDLTKGEWHDHDANEGGGVLNLIRRYGNGADPVIWLHREGLIDDMGIAREDIPRGLGELDAGDDAALDKPPPRGWLLGNIFARKFLSSLLADGAVGKTALRYAQLLSLATGRALTGDHVFLRCRVLIISLEDDINELRRRVLAAMRRYKINRSELKGWLFYAAPGTKGGKLMRMDARGQLTRGALAANIEAVVVARKIDIVAIDPFVKSHAVPENENTAIDEVAQVLTDLMAEHDIAVDTPHHVSKGAADPGNASRGRGASAMKDAARLVYTLTPMSAEEARAFGLTEEERKLLVRMDSGKVNIVPPLYDARWYRLVGVKLDNATDLYKNGDEVQTVEVWTPPATWAGLSEHLMELILADIDAGLPDGNRYTDAPNAGEREAWRVVVKHAQDKSKAQAREIIKAWVETEVLQRRPYMNPKTGKEVTGLWLNPAKRAPPRDQELPF
jgi:hypothetical protein